VSASECASTCATQCPMAAAAAPAKQIKLDNFYSFV